MGVLHRVDRYDVFMGGIASSLGDHYMIRVCVTFRGFGPSQQRTITFNSNIYSRNPRSYMEHLPSRGINTNVYIYNTIIAQLSIIA